MFYVNEDIDENVLMAKYIKWKDGIFDISDSYFATYIKSLPIEGKYKMTLNARADKAAYDIYGDKDLFWVLLWYNDVVDPEALTIGTVIGYPSKTSLANMWLRLELIKRSNG